MKTVAFLTSQNVQSYISDDQLLVAPLKQLGWQVDFVVWDQPQNWQKYAVVLVRTTWDYTEKIEQFLAFVKALKQQNVNLYNSAESIWWNYRKTYLADLAMQGIATIPTTVIESFSPQHLASKVDLMQFDEWIFKPSVSASANNTFRLKSSDWSWRQEEISYQLQGLEVLVQPFIREVLDQGEISLIFFNGQFSHAVKKVPKAGDFRVQEEHGGDITSFEPNREELRVAQSVLDKCGFDLFQARVDLIPHRGQYLLVELEIIEPSLYLRKHPDAPKNFAQAFLSRFGRGD